MTDAEVAQRMIQEGQQRLFKGPTDEQHDEFVALGRRYLRQAEFGIEHAAEATKGDQ
jgi:hypothetical protein